MVSLYLESPFIVSMSVTASLVLTGFILYGLTSTIRDYTKSSSEKLKEDIKKNKSEYTKVFNSIK